MIRWFGLVPFAQICQDAERIPCPVGETCMWCKEAIELGVDGFALDGVPLQVMHMECHFRMIMGSVGHHLKLCSCYGGNDEDPEGMTTRQAAVAALQAWQATNGFHVTVH